MSARKLLDILLRLYFSLFFLFSSAYLLLAFIPFTRPMLVAWNFLPVAKLFATYHSYLYWTAIAAVLPTVISGLHQGEKRRLTIGFLALHVAAGIVLFAFPVLKDPPDDERGYIRALLFLFPLIYLAVLDLTGKRSGVYDERPVQPEEFTYVAAISTGIFVSVLYAGVFVARYGIVKASSAFQWPEQAFVLGTSIISHLCLFSAIFLLLKLCRSVAERSRNPRGTLRCLRFGITAMGGALVIRSLIFPTLIFEGYKADIYATFFCVAAATLAYTTAIALSPEPETDAEVQRLRTPAAGVVGICLIVLFAYFAPIYLARADWNSVLQRLSVLPVWIASFIAIQKIASPFKQRRYSLLVLLILLGSSLAGYKAWGFAQSRLLSVTAQRETDSELLLNRYADFDISYAVTQGLMSALASGRTNTPEDYAFYDFLRQSALLPSSVKIGPAKLELVNELLPNRRGKPHIFIFVIDSLRQDYLSPYNPAVTFTPEIAKFAGESIVMENAFTRYGGTGLSEPSIWTGTMQLHKQYVQPFHSMNNLQKLIETDGYKPYISIDVILKEILKPTPGLEELDKDRIWYKFDLATTLAELEQKLDRRSDQVSDPVFAYSQAQNLHSVGIKMNPANETISNDLPQGLERPQAVQIRHIDRAFGEFVEFLKARGMFDNSIVILTTDHGDSLGEEGHWGHVNFVYPEVMRVPLIIHLPSTLQKKLVWDPKQIAFTCDITPTLFYLLGHRPIINDELYGRPLFAETMEELQSYVRDHYLVANSYGPVYGLLSENGRSLFISDGYQHRDLLYDLSIGFSGAHRPLTEGTRSKYRKLIRTEIDRINTRFGYRF